MPDRKKSGSDMLTFYRRLFLLLYLATILFTVAIEFVFVITGKLTWSSFFLGLGGYTVAIAAIILISYVMVLKAIERSERDNTKLEESEKRYRDLFEDATDLIQSVSPDGRFQYVNRAWRQALGYSEEEVQEITLFDVIHPDSMEHCMEMFERVISGEEVRGVEAVFVSKDGRRVPAEGNVNCRFESVRPVAIRGIFRDVTERKAAEKLLAKQRDLAVLLSMAGDLTETLSLSIQAVLDLTSLDCGGVYLFDEETGDLELVYHQGISQEFVEATSRYQPGSPSAAIVKEGVPRYVTYDEVDVPKTAPQVEEGLKAGAILPLKDAGRVIGCVNVFSHTMEEIPAASREIMEVLIGQIGQLITRSRLFSELRESEERYRLIAENMVDVIWIMDLEFNRTYTSPSVERLRGYTPEEVAGLRPDEIATPESLEAAIRMLAKESEIEKRGETDPDRLSEFEVEQYCKDGSTVWTETTARLLRDADGKPVGILGVGRDIDDRKKAEEELRDSERRLRAITKTARDAIIMIDGDGNVSFWNPAAEETFGYSSEEALGRNLHMLIAPERTHHSHRKGFAAFKETGTGPVVGKTVELTAIRKDGTEFPVELSLSALQIDRSWHAVGTVRDITDRKHHEEELKNANAELDGFSRTVSHDLQGPLTAMKLANDLLSQLMEEPQTESVREDMRQTVQIVGRNITASNRLIKDLLALARAGLVPDSVSSVDVSEVVARVIDENVGSIEGGSIDVVFDDDLGRITANPTHVYQVFSNLIGNAIRHNDSPNPLVKVALLETEGGNLRYLVKDNGSGIPPGDTDRIFIPFFKGKSGETGIGLATVKKIVRTNGWEIRAYNDNGACFELILKPPRTLPTPTTI